MSTPVLKEGNAVRDSEGNEYLSSEPWQQMGTRTMYGRVTEYVENALRKVSGDLNGEDLIRVIWLSITLFFVVGGYWLLRSLKDPIMSVIDGVEYIPQAKIASLFVVFALVIVYNKLLDIYPKHQLFYMMGAAYGVLFTLMGFALMHPTIGLQNTNSDPSRILGWLSYVTIESFGSMVVQCYWALVNASVDVHFAKKNFGLIVAGAQIGSILGPTVATQASVIGVPVLYLFGAAIMFFMVGAMYLYIKRFGAPADDAQQQQQLRDKGSSAELSSKAGIAPGQSSKDGGAGKSGKSGTGSKKEEGVLEGFYLFYEHDYVKGIFAISSFFMIQVTVIDYMMKVLAKERYSVMYPDDPQAALRGFASFMGYFGQTTNSISFLFSLFGTGAIIKRCGLTVTLIAFPVLLLVCTLAVWISPNIWVVFGVMMVIKGMSYALNNPTKEILYQATSTSIKFKCKSWIDTFGQRSSKAAGSIITNQFATSMVDLLNYGSGLGLVMSAFLIWVSHWMGRRFEELQERGEKVGDYTQVEQQRLAVVQNADDDTSCGLDEEGQSSSPSPRPQEEGGKEVGSGGVSPASVAVAVAVAVDADDSKA